MTNEIKPREFWIDDSHPDEKIIMKSPDNWEMHCWSKPIHVREVTPQSEQELEEIRRDKARLDWMIDTGIYPNRSLKYGYTIDLERYFQTFRECIDAAMESK